MLLQPKKVKYKKVKKGKLSKFCYKNVLHFGTIGLKATESGIITARQLESARQAISRKIKKKGKLWIKIYPHIPITKKPQEVRMGKGKGNVSHWASKVRGGSILFAIKAFITGGAKLPIKTQIFD